MGFTHYAVYSAAMSHTQRDVVEKLIWQLRDFSHHTRTFKEIHAVLHPIFCRLRFLTDIEQSLAFDEIRKKTNLPMEDLQYLYIQRLGVSCALVSQLGLYELEAEGMLYRHFTVSELQELVKGTPPAEWETLLSENGFEAAVLDDDSLVVASPLWCCHSCGVPLKYGRVTDRLTYLGHVLVYMADNCYWGCPACSAYTDPAKEADLDLFFKDFKKKINEDDSALPESAKATIKDLTLKINAALRSHYPSESRTHGFTQLIERLHRIIHTQGLTIDPLREEGAGSSLSLYWEDSVKGRVSFELDSHEKVVMYETRRVFKSMTCEPSDSDIIDQIKRLFGAPQSTGPESRLSERDGSSPE